MRKRSKHLLVLGTAMCVAAGLSVVAPEAAQADSGYGYCWRSSCNNGDPDHFGCSSSAYTVSSYIDNRGYELDLRYSPGCDSNWARVITPTSQRFCVRNALGNRASWVSAPGQVSWTDMVDGSVSAVAKLAVPPTYVTGSTGYWADDEPASGVDGQYTGC